MSPHSVEFPAYLTELNFFLGDPSEIKWRTFYLGKHLADSVGKSLWKLIKSTVK